MTGELEPRTWVLRGWYEGEENERDYVSEGPKIGPRGPVKVVEAEPVADQLAELYLALTQAPRLPNDRCYRAWKELGALLHTLGRLEGGRS